MDVRRRYGDVRRIRLATLCALIALSLPSAGTTATATATRAALSGRLPGAQLTCPADVARNSILGVALTLPAGWQEESPASYPIFLSDPTLFFFVPTGGDGNPRLLIAGLGTTTDPNEARAANAAADWLVRNSGQRGVPLPGPVTHQPITIAGAPGVLLRGLPAQTANVQVVLAHAGALYHFIAFGSDEGLQADHRAALASLRFIPRLGAFPPFPPAPHPAPHPFATVPTLALTRTGAGHGPLTVRAAGHGYLPHEAVELDTCWRGRPRPGRHPLYTSYVLTQVVTAGRDGILDVVVTIPVRPADYTSYTLRTLARDSRIGFRLAAATRRS
jgi:hypothetical protein